MQTREVSVQTSLVLSAAAEARQTPSCLIRACAWGFWRPDPLGFTQPTLLLRRRCLARPMAASCARLFRPFEQAVYSASFSPDGKRVVTASRDKTARVWDAETGKPVGEAMTHG